jgi:hypothetical protein
MIEVYLLQYKTAIAFGALVLLSLRSPVLLHAQQGDAPTQSQKAEGQSDPAAELSPENRGLFQAMLKAVHSGDDAETLADCKKLLPSLQPGTRLSKFVTQVAATSATDVGEDSYALSLILPVTSAHPDDWQAAALLARIYAESGDVGQRDRQITAVIDLHKRTSDPDFAKLHLFPIQKVKLRSGYAEFLYPFEPLGRHHSYLIALINDTGGNTNFRLELESDDVDQSFFKPKHQGERRFSIDSYWTNKENPNLPDSQALHGFIDGRFDYDLMRDAMVKAANLEQSGATSQEK